MRHAQNKDNLPGKFKDLSLYRKASYGLIVSKKIYEKLTQKDLTENWRIFEEKGRRFYRSQKRVSLEGEWQEKNHKKEKQNFTTPTWLDLISNKCKKTGNRQV